MENIKPVTEEHGVHAKVITPDDNYHYFFGYYDLQPFDSTGRYHLCQRVKFDDRQPTPTDVSEIGVIDLQTNEFIKYSETTAWNFQQGSLLQWYKDDEHIIFNVREDNAFKSCVLNVKTGEKRILPMAFANLSNDCTKALCVNFSRIFDFRAGYGYAGIPDKFFDEKAPEEDGVFLMDTETGEVKLILNYVQLRDAYFEEPFSNDKLLVNHINFNPSGTRFAMLFRNFTTKEQPLWRTQLITGDLNGDVYRMSPFGVHSHYHWKNDKELLIYSYYDANNPDKGLWVFTDKEDKAEKLPQPNPTNDIHCVHSPNRRYIMGDDYGGLRSIHFIDTKTNTKIYLGQYKSYNTDANAIEYRCDLHARFDRTGRYISFDSNHTGKRVICIMDLKDLKDYEY